MDNFKDKTRLEIVNLPISKSGKPDIDEADDGPVQRKPLLHQAMKIPSLVGTMEIAEADMHDPGRKLSAIVGRCADTFGYLIEGCVRQFHQLIQFPPSTL